MATPHPASADSSARPIATGRFQTDPSVEKAWVMQRKPIVALALKAGVPIVPVYAFGHSLMWTVVADPFRLLERLSVALDVALCPFYGRWGWPVGPPRRVPILMALGEPIACPLVEKPSRQLVDEYHAKMVAGFKSVFDTHKEAYGWAGKELHFV